MAMSPQQQQAMMRGYTPQGVPVYMGAHPQMQRLMQQQQQSRRKSLADKKKTKRVGTVKPRLSESQLFEPSIIWIGIPPTFSLN